jgi:uncharacterized membrane protein YqjE
MSGSTDHQSTKSSFRRIYTGVLDLAFVRAKLFSIEVAEQKEALIIKIALIFTIFVCMFLGFITLLFALNALLPEPTKIWVFFSLCALFFIISLGSLWKVVSISKHQISPFTTTLNELKKDLQALQGKEEDEL